MDHGPCAQWLIESPGQICKTRVNVTRRGTIPVKYFIVIVSLVCVLAAQPIMAGYDYNKAKSSGSIQETDVGRVQGINQNWVGVKFKQKDNLKAVGLSLSCSGGWGGGLLMANDWAQFVNLYNSAIQASASVAAGEKRVIGQVGAITVYAESDGNKRWVGLGGRMNNGQVGCVQLDGSGCRQFNDLVTRANSLLSQ
jgi:hypothetical protein